MVNSLSARGSKPETDGSLLTLESSAVRGTGPFVMVLKPRRGTRARGWTRTPVDAACALAWDGPEDPGYWRRSCARCATARRDRAGRRRGVGRRAPDGARRLVVTAGSATPLPSATW